MAFTLIDDKPVKGQFRLVDDAPKLTAYEQVAQDESTLDNVIAGIGGGMYGTYLGAKQLLGQADEQEIQQYKDSMEGLRSTAGGFAGDIIGQSAVMIPAGAGAFAAGAKVSPKIAGLANSIGGRAGLAAVSGGTQGALIPTTEDESKAGNIVGGAMLGAGASGVLDKAAKTMVKVQNRVQQKMMAREMLNNPQVNIQVDNYLQNAGIDLTKLSDEAQKKAKEFAVLAMDSGADVSPLALTNQAVLESLPVPIKGSKGQLGQDFFQQENERVLADIGVLGSGLRDTFEEQKGQLSQNFDELIKGTGGTTQSTKELGEGLQGDVLSRYNAAKESTKQAYKTAEEIAGQNIGRPSAELIDWFNKNRGFDDVKGLITQGKELGLFKTDKSGRLIAQEAPLRNFYQLRKSISTRSQNNGALGEAKSLVDKTFDDYGGDAYKVAASLRRQQGETFESGAKAVQDLALKKATSTDMRTNVENVFNRLAINGTRDDIINVKKLLATGSDVEKKASEQQLNNLKKQTIEYLKDAAVKDNNGKTGFTAAGLEQAYNRIGKENLEEILGKAGLSQLNDLVKAASITQKQQPRIAGNSATAARMANMALSLFNILEKIPVVGTPVKVLGTKTVQATQARNAIKQPLEKVSEKMVQKQLTKQAPKIQTVRSLLTGAGLESGQED